MTPGEAYTDGMLVRVVGEASRGADKPPMPFVAGIIFDRATMRAVITAPILSYLRGQHADQLRRTFRRMGWRATIVR